MHITQQNMKQQGIPHFFLQFGHSPHLPIDLIFGTYPSSTPNKYRDFVKNWKTATKEAYALEMNV